MTSIATMSLADLQTVLDWAAAEGWNPGLDDAEAFHAADPAGYFIARQGNLPIAAVSVIKQDDRNGFLGLYICKPEYRGQGVGWQVWQAGIQYLQGMTIGLDGVVEQQDNYRKSGFQLAYRNRRYQGLPIGLAGAQPGCRAASPVDLPAIAALDKAVHGVDRQHFIHNWVTDTRHRTSLVITDGMTVTGFGTIRACQQGHKVGPLIAKDSDDAHRLLSSLVATAAAHDIILDVPEPNTHAVNLAEAAGLENTFETARMYRGSPPEYHLQRLFGVTTFELG